MLIAIAANGTEVSNHFGHCEKFYLVQINDGLVGHINIMTNPGHRPGFLPGFLAEQGTNLIIAGGMGQSAQELFHQQGIEIITGARGPVKEALLNYLDGTLVTNGAVCTNHEHSHECHG